MDRPIKILYLITDLGKGGAERFLTDTVMALQKNHNVQCKIGLLFNNVVFPEIETELDLLDLKYATFSFRKKNLNPIFEQLIDEFKPDIIHTNRFLAEFLTIEQISPSIKYVCHGHDNMVQLENWKWSNLWNKSSFINFLEKLLLIVKKYRKVDTHFIANSADTYSYFQRVLLAKDCRNIHLIHNAVDLSKFETRIAKSIDIQHSLRLINVGSFQPKKNQLFLIEIAKFLKDKKVDFELNLLGDGTERPLVEERIKQYGLEHHVFLRGVQHNVEDWLKKSDIYLHSAWYEPFGIVLLEAMAAGLPVITLDGKGNRVLIEQGKNGYLFDQQNAQLFGETILALVNDSIEYSAMSEYAKKFVKQFDIVKKADEYFNFYKSLIKDSVKDK